MSKAIGCYTRPPAKLLRDLALEYEVLDESVYAYHQTLRPLKGLLRDHESGRIPTWIALDAVNNFLQGGSRLPYTAEELLNGPEPQQFLDVNPRQWTIFTDDTDWFIENDWGDINRALHTYPFKTLIYYTGVDEDLLLVIRSERQEYREFLSKDWNNDALYCDAERPNRYAMGREGHLDLAYVLPGHLDALVKQHREWG